MRRLKQLGLVLGLTALVTSPAFAAANATCDEAQAMLTKAVALVKADGIEKSVPKFMDKSGSFVDRDLYVFVMDKDGVFHAHGQKPALIGKNGKTFKDADGMAFIEKFFEVKDKGSVTYRWSDPVDNKVKTKTSYMEWVGPMLVGVGCYKD